MSNERSKESSESRRVVVNDASCLIDLHKVGLVEAMLRLPYDFVVALPIAHNEVLDFTDEDWAHFSDAGLEKVDLDPLQVGRAIDHQSQNAKLSAEDCFSLVLAQDCKDSILLTGDAELRSVAIEQGCEVHGVLWVADEIHSRRLIAESELAKKLNIWLIDPLVRLPVDELNRRLRLLSAKGEAEAKHGSPTTKVPDRYFRTEKEAIDDARPIAADAPIPRDNRGDSREPLAKPTKAQKTRAIATLSPPNSRHTNDQIDQRRPDPAPYFVREIGGSIEAPEHPPIRTRKP
jgi:predicted nucleic acid-binding protein